MHARVTFLFVSLAVAASLPRLLVAQTTSAPQSLVIDDHDPRCQFEGGVPFEGYMRDATVNVGITASQEPNAKVIWKPGVVGRYYLQVHWQTHMGYHELRAVYTVNSAEGAPQRFTTNQKLTAAGGVQESIAAADWMASGWYTLGGHAWLLDGDSTVELTKLSPGTEWLVADALRVGKDLIVDELSTAAFYPAGKWRLCATRSPAPENTQVAVSPDAHALVRLMPGLEGQHRVALSWAAHPQNSPQATYVIDLDGDPDTENDQTGLTIDQRLLCDQKTAGSEYTWSGWYQVPEPLPLRTGTTLTLLNTAGTGNLVADGVKLCAVDDPPSRTPIEQPLREQPRDLPRGAVEEPGKLETIIGGFQPAKVTNAVVDQPNVKQVSLCGRLGQRHRANADFLLSLLAKNEDFMLAAYRLRDERTKVAEWDGEYAGKWLDAAVLTAANLDHVELREKLTAFSRAIRDQQDSDGCVGTEGPLRRGRNQWGTWMPWYMMTGWLDQHEQFGDPAPLVAAWRAAQWIINYYGPIDDENRIFYEYATMEGGSNVALIDQLCRLYQHTGDDRIRQFARDAVRQFPRFAEMKQTGKAPAVHVYVLLADLGAAVQLAVLDDDQEQLAWLEKVWEEIHGKYMYPTGSLSLGEQLVMPTDEPNGHHQETCATVEWLLLSRRLYLATGHVRYQHAVEDTVYNALLGAQSTDGLKWMYYTPLRYEKKWISGPTACCYHSGPRGVARLPSMVYATDREGLRVDLFEASNARLEVNGIAVQITQRTDYPTAGESTLVFHPERPADFTLRIRLPRWISQASLSWNGEPLSCEVTPGEYVEIRRTFCSGDQLNVRFDMPVRLRAMKDAGVAIVRGPEVMSVDRRDNPDLDFDSIRIPESVKLLAAESDGPRRRYRADVLVNGQARTVLLTPFAEAGNGDARFRTVFPSATSDSTDGLPRDDG